MYTRGIQAVSSRNRRERLMLRLIFNSDLSHMCGKSNVVHVYSRRKWEELVII